MNWNEDQLNAINLENTNIIVSAGAGSGKTAVLTERVIRKIKSGIPINKLLILTFTNLAAKEMKDRIKKKLIENNLLESLSLIDSSYITTFDSYSLKLVQKYHYLLNISKNIKICDKNILLIQENKILDNIFEKLYEENNEKFIKLINNFCVKNDKQIRNFIINTNEKMNQIINLDEYLKNYISNFYNENYLNNICISYNNLIKENIKELDNLLKSMEIIDNSYNETIYNMIEPLLNSKSISEINLNSNICLPNLKKGSSEELKELKKIITEKIKEIYELSKKDDNIIKNEILETKEYCEIIIDILKELNKELNNYKQENEFYDFIDIEFLAIKLLKDNESIRIELKNFFNEIMIDEYQDTNDIQEEFISLIMNNNVYMVGDIKQSIYRFRNANPYIFKNKYDSYNGDIGTRINLNQNFRSRKEVLNDINTIFNEIMHDDIGGADYKKDHNLKYGNLFNDDINNPLSIYNYNYDKDTNYKKVEIETNIIINDIKEKIKNNYQVKIKDKLKNIEYSDFCILVDRMTDSETILKIFETSGIPLTRYSDNSITDNIDMLIIKNIIKIIIKMNYKKFDEEFKYLFYSIGRSYLFEYSDEYLFKTTLSNNYQETDLYQKLHYLSSIIPTSTINDIIHEIIKTFNINEKQLKIPNIEENIIGLEYLVNLGNDFSNYGWTIFSFSEYLDSLTKEKFELKYSLNKENPNSVKLMTIHGSKGLEFNVCYYMGLDNNFNMSDIKDHFIYDKKYGIITPFFNEGLNETILKTLVKNEYYKEEISEKIRLLYVALTRTKEKMILITNNYENKDNNQNIKYKSFRDLLLNLKEKFKSNIKNIDTNELNINLNYKYGIKNDLKEIPLINNKIKVNELNLETTDIENKTYSKNLNKLFSKEEKQLLKMGENVHKILETIDLKNPNFDSIDEFIKTKIKKFINSDLIKDINNANIYKEHEFMYEKDNIKYHGIIDLLLEYDDYIRIIDYKLKNINDENYIKQLKGYKEYINSLTNKKIELYLYSIIEEIYEKIE